MASLPEIESILFEAQKMEKMAEDNCTKILDYLKANGMYEQINRIKADERHHQEIVGDLLQFLKS